MRTALRSRLNDVQFKQLKTVAFQRLQDLRGERQAQGMERKLEKFERVAASDFQHRLCPDLLNQSIFDRSNQSLQIVRSIVRFLKARMAKDLFGSNPWFSAHAEGPASFVLAGEIQKHADWKLREGDYKVTAKAALEVALDLGWVALKTTWKTITDYSEQVQSILYDPEAPAEGVESDAGDYPLGGDPNDEEQAKPKATKGAPVVAPDGSYITQDDETQDAPQVDGDGNPVTGDDGSPVMTTTFTKSPQHSPPGTGNKLQWKDHAVEQSTRLYYGIDMQPIYWKDVLWPINAPKVDLESCDCITHTREMTKDELRAQYDPDGTDTDVQSVLATLQSGSTQAKAQANVAKPEFQESEAINSDHEAGTFKVTEMYMRRTLPGASAPSRILVVLVEEAGDGAGSIVWCDYLANLSPRAECPIHVVAVNRIPGRAYGRGLYEIYEMPAAVCDRIINSVLWRNAINSDPVKFWNPSLTKEGDSDPHLTIEPGKTYTAKNPQTKASDILSVVEIPDLDQRSWTMLELFMQLIQTESGVTNANQGDMSDLPSNNTATGVNSLLESSSVLHFDVLEDLRDGLTSPLRYAVELIYFRQDSDETYEYLEGNASAVMTLGQAAQLAKLGMHVEILLTRTKNQELRDAALAAIPHGWNFWQALRSDPQSALHMLPLYLQVFKALDIDNADSFFPKAQDIQAMVDQQNAAQQQQPPQPGAPGQEPQPLAPLVSTPDSRGPVAQPADPGMASSMPAAPEDGSALPRNVIPAAQ